MFCISGVIWGWFCVFHFCLTSIFTCIQCRLQVLMPSNSLEHHFRRIVTVFQSLIALFLCMCMFCSQRCASRGAIRSTAPVLYLENASKSESWRKCSYFHCRHLCSRGQGRMVYNFSINVTMYKVTLYRMQIQPISRYQKRMLSRI